VQEIKDDLDRLDKVSGPGWPRRRCHVDVATAARIRGAVIVVMAHGEVRLEAVELGRRSLYSGPMLFDLATTFLIVRSFTDKPKGSKLHRTSIISGKAMNRKKILNNVRSQQNIVKIEWAENNRVSYGGDWQAGTITYNDG
jgi:hypothetical protein